MAADENTIVKSCIHDPNFAIICSFFEKFSSSCGIKGPTFVELQRMIDSKTEIPPELIDLHIRLMRKAKKNVNPDRWQRTLSKFCYFQLPDVCWELEQKGYENLNHAQRLKILLTLIGAQFDYNVKFKTDVNKLNVNELRLSPFGKDKDGNSYWVHTDEELNLNVYKEDLDEEKWELIVTDRDGLENLINDLMKDKDPNRELEAIANDDESDPSNEEEEEKVEEEHELDERLYKEDANPETNAEDELDDETVPNKNISNRSGKSVETIPQKTNHLLAAAKKILTQNRPVLTYSKKLNFSKSPLMNVRAPTKSSTPLDVINLPGGKVTITKSLMSPYPRQKFVGSKASHPMALDKERFAQHLQQLASQDMLLPLLNDDGAPDTVDELKTIISAKLNKNVDVKKAKDFIARTADILKPKLQQSGNSSEDKTAESKIVKVEDEEEIEEPLMVITGTGNGRDCDTGNEKDAERTESAPSSALVSHKMDDILKNSDQTEHNDDQIPASSMDIEKKKPKLWTIDAICSSDTKETKSSRSDDDVSLFPNYSFNREAKKENSLFRNTSMKEYSSVFGFSNESNESTVTTIPTNFYFGSNNQNPCFLPTTIVPEARVNNFTMSSAKSHNVKDIVDDLDDKEKVKSSTNFRVENLCTSTQGTAFDLCIRKEGEIDVADTKNLETTKNVGLIVKTKKLTENEIEKSDVEIKQSDAHLLEKEIRLEKQQQCFELNYDMENKFHSRNERRIETESESNIAVDLSSRNSEFKSEVEFEEETNLENDLNERCKSKNEAQKVLKPENNVIEGAESNDDEHANQKDENQSELKLRSSQLVEEPHNDEIMAEAQQTECHPEDDLTLNSLSQKTVESSIEVASKVDLADFENKPESVSDSITAKEIEKMPANELETEVVQSITSIQIKSNDVDLSTNITVNAEYDAVSLSKNKAVNEKSMVDSAKIINDDSKSILEPKMEVENDSRNRCSKVTIESVIESNEIPKSIIEESVCKLQPCTALPVTNNTEELEEKSSLEEASHSIELKVEVVDQKEASQYRKIIGELKTNEHDSSSASQKFIETLKNDRSDVYLSELDKGVDNKETIKITNNAVKIDKVDESSSPDTRSPCNETASVDEETSVDSEYSEKLKLMKPVIIEGIAKSMLTENVPRADPSANTIIEVSKSEEEMKLTAEPTELSKQNESFEDGNKKSNKSNLPVVERRSTRSLRSTQTQNRSVESSPPTVKTPSSKKNTNQEKTDVEADVKLLQKEETKKSETPKPARGGWPKGKPRGKAAAKAKIKEEPTLETVETKEGGENGDKVKQMKTKVKGRPSKSVVKSKIEESEEEKEDKTTLKTIIKSKTENEENDEEEMEETKPKSAVKKKTSKHGWMNEIDASNIETSISGTLGIRQSRRIAQLKIKEQAEIKYLEHPLTEKKGSTNQKSKTNLSTKKSVKTPTKKWSKSYKPPKEDSDDGSLGEKSTPKKKKKKKEVTKFDVKNAWKASSDSSSEEEEDEEHFEEEEEELVVNEASDHEFSPESDIDEDEDYTPVKRARTAHSKPLDEDTSALDNLNCQNCNKADQPEWILLCDACDEGWHAACLKPPLMSIPEGDWFCPPCQHNKLITSLQQFMKTYDRNMKKRTNELLRKKRLEFVRISHLNIINEPKTKIAASLTKNESSSSGEYTNEESEEEPLYQLRVRRQANVSHRLNEYDEIMNSAIQRENGAILVEEATTIPAAISQVSDDQQTIVNEEVTTKKANEDEKESVDDENDKEENETSQEEEESASKEDKVAPAVLQLRNVRKKSARLTKLDVSSEDDRYSDEDFKESSDEVDDDDEYGKSDSDSEDVVPVRRSTRARRKRYDEDFINDDSEDEKDKEQEQKKKKRKRSMYSESDSEEEDSTWGKRKKNKQSKPWKPPQKKRKRIIFADESDDDRKKTKKSRVRYGLEEDSGDDYPQRRTRGKKINYTDNLQSESEEETASTKRRQAKKVISDEEDDEYVNDEEEEENDEGSGKEEEADENKISESEAKSASEKSKSTQSTSDKISPSKTNGPIAPLPPKVSVVVPVDISSSNFQNIPKLETSATLNSPVQMPSSKLKPTNVSLESMQSMTQNLTAPVIPAPPSYSPLQSMQISPVQEVKFSPPGPMIRPAVSVNYTEMVSPYPDPQQHQRLAQIQHIEDDKFSGPLPKLYPVPEHRQQQLSLSPIQLQQQTQQRVISRSLPPYGVLQQIPSVSMMGPAPGSQMMLPRAMGNALPPMRGPLPPQMRARPPPPLQVATLPTMESQLPTSTQGQPSSVRHMGPSVTTVSVPVPTLCTPPTGENKRGKRGRGKKTLEKERLEREALEASRIVVAGGDKTTPGNLLKASLSDVNVVGPRPPSVTYAVSSTSPQQPFPMYSNGQRISFTQPPLQTAAVTVTVGSNASAKRVKITPTRMRMPNVSQHFPQPQSPSATGASFSHDSSLPPVTSSGDAKGGSVPVSAALTTISKSEAPPSKMETSSEQYSHSTASFASNQIPRGYNQRPEFTYVRNPMPPMYRGSPPVSVTPPKIIFSRPPYSNTRGPPPTSMSSTSSKPSDTPQVSHSQPYSTLYPPSTIAAPPPSTTANPPTSAYQSLHYKQLPPTPSPQSSASGIPYTQTPYYTVPSPYPSQLPPVSSFRSAGPPPIAYKPSTASPNVRPAEYATPPPRTSSQNVGFQYSESSGDTNETFNQSSSFAGENERTTETNGEENAEQNSEETTTGEFGGLVSYFSSQRENDLDS